MGNALVVARALRVRKNDEPSSLLHDENDENLNGNANARNNTNKRRRKRHRTKWEKEEESNNDITRRTRRRVQRDEDGGRRAEDHQNQNQVQNENGDIIQNNTLEDYDDEDQLVVGTTAATTTDPAAAVDDRGEPEEGEDRLAILAAAISMTPSPDRLRGQEQRRPRSHTLSSVGSSRIDDEEEDIIPIPITRGRRGGGVDAGAHVTPSPPPQQQQQQRRQQIIQPQQQQPAAAAAGAIAATAGEEEENAAAAAAADARVQQQQQHDPQYLLDHSVDNFFPLFAKGDGNECLISLLVVKCMLSTIVKVRQNRIANIENDRGCLFTKELYVATGKEILVDDDNDDGNNIGTIIRLEDFFDNENKLVEACRNVVRKYRLRKTVLETGIYASNTWITPQNYALSKSAVQEWELIRNHSIRINLLDFDYDYLNIRPQQGAHQQLQYHGDNDSDGPDNIVEVITDADTGVDDRIVDNAGHDELLGHFPILRPAIIAALSTKGHITRKLILELYRYRQLYQQLRIQLLQLKNKPGNNDGGEEDGGEDEGQLELINDLKELIYEATGNRPQHVKI